MNKTKKWAGTRSLDTPIRKEPSAEAERVGTIKAGEAIAIRDTVKGWYYVGEGYVSTKRVKTNYKPTLSVRCKWVGKTTARVIARGWCWSGAAPVTVIAKGETVKVLDTKEGYYYIAYNGRKGFVPAEHIKYDSDPITPALFLKQVKATQEYARAHGYVYGDSQSKTPTADKKISCDRLVSKALWDLGFTDQPKGGAALGRGFESYLEKCGFKKTTTAGSIKAGSVCVVMNPSGTSRHVFVVESSKFNAYKRYDCGSLQWIRCKQPLVGLWMSQLLGVYNL